MDQQLRDFDVNEAWNHAMQNWNSPSVPHVIAMHTREERQKLGDVGSALEKELAFMQYPQFQVYMNLERIAEEFSANPQRGARAVATHEIGHRFCPYDAVTAMILNHAIAKELAGKQLPYDAKAVAGNILNLFTDMCINTRLSHAGNEDIAWAYAQMSQTKKERKLWRVYGKSMELAWNKEILPKDTVFNEGEMKAAGELADLFKEDFFHRNTWRAKSARYASIISPFLENDDEDKKSGMGNTASKNVPQTLDDNVIAELTKRLAEIGSNGLPQNPTGMKDFQEIMAGYGRGDKKKASIHFYELLSRSYEVMFATQPFGRPRANPFQPVKWNPSMGADQLDVDYSVQAGGRIIPGTTTYTWNTRKRETRGGMEEIVPDLDMYLDSSQSMPDPCESISLPVLAGFVVAKKAHRKGARVRVTNFSDADEQQCVTQEFTRDLPSVLDVLVTHYNGGTVFPKEVLLAGQDPKQVVIITDAFLGNEEETAEAITELRQRHRGNKVAIYEIHAGRHGGYLRNAGAEVIQGTTTDIFKRVIGKVDEVYKR